MGAWVVGAGFHLSQLSPTYSPASSSAHAMASVICSFYSNRNFISTIVHVGAGGEQRTSSFLGLGPSRAPSLEWRSGRVGRRRQEGAPRKAFRANLESFTDDEDEEFVRRLQELALQLRHEEQQQQQQAGAEDAPSSSFSSIPTPTSSPSSPLSKRPELLVEPPWLPVQPEPPDWPQQIVHASVERNANSVGLPLSLRIIKERKKRWVDSFEAAGEEPSSWRCSVKKAFSSMVFMVRELHSYALQLREAIFYEDLRGILDRVQREMNSSFVWLFQQIFSGTPMLMVSVMLLLANFTVYSMGHNATAIAAPSAAAANPSSSQPVVTSLVQDDQPRRDAVFDKSSIKTFSIGGRTASIGGNGGGGGKVKPVAGSTDDGRSDSSSFNYRIMLPEGISKIPSTTIAGNGDSKPSASVVELQEEVEEKTWKGLLEEVRRMKASTMDEALVDPETLRLLVAPMAAKVEAEDSTEYLQTELMYQQALQQEPHNNLLLANFAQFLYLVLHDHDRAEEYFKRAVAEEPADAEALSRYASFLWMARNDLTAAEEMYLEAIDADPGNTSHAANYAHFLWNTGGEDTCFPLDDAPDAAL